MGDGGALLTNIEQYAAVAKTWRNYGQTDRYLHLSLAAIMSTSLLPRLTDLTERRQVIAKTYNISIPNPLITIPPAPIHSHSVYHLSPVLVNGNREHFREHLKQQGIETVIHYPTPLQNQPALRNYPYVIALSLRVRRFRVTASRKQRRSFHAQLRRNSCRAFRRQAYMGCWDDSHISPTPKNRSAEKIRLDKPD